MKGELFEKARLFVYRNARPLDFALWRYHFESGKQDDVLSVLSAYQNKDGGFGHAIEPDNFNINSTPIGTWAAIGKLNKIDFTDKNHPIVQGILKYLDSGKDFAEGKWFNTVKSNNDYPHAVWWGCDKPEGDPCDNPTVSLAGFAIRFADKNSPLYAKACEIIKDAAQRFIDNPETEMHTLRCYLEMYEYCVAAGANDLFDMQVFKAALIDAIEKTICSDTDKWVTEYVCKPSMFFTKSQLLFDIVGRELCKQEAELIASTQQPDGAFPVTWLWYNDYKEFEIAANWWKSAIIIDNMLYFKALES